MSSGPVPRQVGDDVPRAASSMTVLPSHSIDPSACLLTQTASASSASRSSVGATSGPVNFSFIAASSMGNRTVLQGAQAESEGQDLRRDQRERPENPDLDSPHRPASPAVAPLPVPGRMVPVQSCVHGPPESLYVQGLDGVAPRSLRDTSNSPDTRSTAPGPPGYWTADWRWKGVT